jgi:NAD(P)-dependent dehydrogenase (short-subunit alcohol dehydrogenase family)
VITGGNAGLGLATAVGVARTGASVILAVRSAAKGAAAAEHVRGVVPGASVDVMSLDLASLTSIRTFASALGDRLDSLDVLINNAGLTMKQRTVTADGFETTFGVNHLGHFLLTNLLHDRLAAAESPRVVVVASDAHRFARRGMAFDDLHSERKYGAMRVYGASKLANMLFTREASRRWSPDGITVNCLHPGFVATRIGRDGDGGRLGEVAATVLRPFAKSPERGARTSVFLATSPEPAGVTGTYFVNSHPKQPAATALDDAAAARLWQVSSELVGLNG